MSLRQLFRRRLRRRLIRRLVAGSATALVAFAVNPAAVPASAVSLDSYGATAESWGVDIRVVPIAQQGTFPDLADEFFPHTFAKIDSLPHAIADGEFFDPGALVRIGPNLGNNVFLQNQLIPNYPYIAQTSSDASSQRDVDRNAVGPQTPEPGLPTIPLPTLPTGFGAASSHAHADSSPYADATGAVGSVNLGGVTVASVSGESSAKQAGGVVTAATSTTMHGVDLLGAAGVPGIIHIDSVTVTGLITTSGPGTAKTQQSVSYDGVTVAGVPSTIDQDGLHIGGSAIPNPVIQTAQSTLATLLASVPLSPHLTWPHATGMANPDGTASVSIDGFGMDFSDQQNVSGLLSLGHAELSARALPSEPVSSSGSQGAGTTTDTGTTGTVTAGISGTDIPGTPGNGGRHPTTTIITTSGGHGRFLIVPIVAFFGELSLVILVIQAYRWWRRPDENTDNLLAL